jgi:hypothetical protein
LYDYYRYKNFNFPRSTRDMLRNATTWLKNTYAADWAPQQAPVSNKAPVPAALKPNKKTVVCMLSELMGYDDIDDDADAEAAEDEAALDEVEAYLALPQQPPGKHGVEFDLLDWWKKHSTMFPNLSRMARQVLAPPACSSGVERLFSAVGRMHDDFRKGTKEVTLQHLTLVYKNLA